MTYNPNIPQASDRPSISQGQLLINAQQLNNIFNVNHSAFASLTNAGKHTYVAMVAQAVPTTVAGEGAAYVFNTGGTREQLRYVRESAGIEIPLTEWVGGFVSFNSRPALILKQYNVATVTSTGVATTFDVVFTTAMTDANYVVVGSSEAADTSCQISNRTVNGFRVKFPDNPGVTSVVCSLAIFGEQV